jgi:hypothetical protein
MKTNLIRFYLTEMTLLKEHIGTVEKKLFSLKTKKAKEKQLSELQKLRSVFKRDTYRHGNALIEIINEALKKDKGIFNIMSVIGGPYHAESFETIKVRELSIGARFQLECKGQDGVSYVGFLDLLENPCGMDNLKRLNDLIK